jgi:predicted alpha/beta superfamily hydrolase
MKIGDHEIDYCIVAVKEFFEVAVKKNNLINYRNMKNIILASIVFLAFSLNAVGQKATFVDHKLVPDHSIESKINKRSYELYVSLPKGYSAKDSLLYPVLYYLDGALLYYTFHGTRIVLDLDREIEKVIIVGIGSSETEIRSWFDNRHTDYSPSYSKESDLKYNTKTKSGGASKFLAVLKNEIIPFVDAHYKSNDNRGLVGSSLGGLFTAYCLVKEPKLFNRYGINSPALWWQDKEVLKMEKSFPKQNSELNIRVFASVGALDPAVDMEKNMIAFCKSLRSSNYKGLEVSSKVFDGETHMSVIAAQVSRTLTSLYGVKK